MGLEGWGRKDGVGEEWKGEGIGRVWKGGVKC